MILPVSAIRKLVVSVPAAEVWPCSFGELLAWRLSAPVTIWLRHPIVRVPNPGQTFTVEHPDGTRLAPIVTSYVYADRLEGTLDLAPVGPR